MENATTRFLSLDVFRGMTICFMIIVNTPGSGATPFAPLLHADWHGFTPTDLVYPSFMFVVGNAMSFAMKKYQDLSDAAVLARIFKRTALIFLLGFLMYWFPFFRVNEAGDIIAFPLSETRIMGVLQRIAICYGIASLLVHFLSPKKVIWLGVLFLLGYWMALVLWGDSTDPFSLPGNAGLALDRFLFGDKHLIREHGVAFEPEGLLSNLPAIVNVVVGYYAGVFVQAKGKGYESIARLLLTGCVFVVVALGWNMVFPINKKLWTSSFVLLTTGIDLVIMAALIYSIEIKDWNKWNWTRFFIIPGKNPLFIYLLSELLVITLYMIPASPGVSVLQWLNSALFQPLAPGAVGSLLFAISFMLLCWSVGWMLDRRKIYIRV